MDASHSRPLEKVTTSSEFKSPKIARQPAGMRQVGNVEEKAVTVTAETQQSSVTYVVPAGNMMRCMKAGDGGIVNPHPKYQVVNIVPDHVDSDMNESGESIRNAASPCEGHMSSVENSESGSYGFAGDPQDYEPVSGPESYSNSGLHRVRIVIYFSSCLLCQ